MEIPKWVRFLQRINVTQKSMFMKKFYLLLLCTVFAMVATTSCMKEEAQEASIEEIVATTELPEMVDGWEGTRTEIYDTETGGIELWWAPKESIGVYGTGLKNVKFTSNNKNKDAVSASFSGGSRGSCNYCV